jgi:hypothetical protein
MGETMKRIGVMILALVLLATVLSPLGVFAQRPTVVNGGGTGSVDGSTVFSQFGMGVLLHSDGSAQGHFQCLMAGLAAIPGLHLMSVGGRVTSGALNPDGSVTFSGVGTVNLGDSGKLTDEPFTVTVTAGGVGVGTLQLSCGPCGGALPIETIFSGRIDIR